MPQRPWHGLWACHDSRKTQAEQKALDNQTLSKDAQVNCSQIAQIDNAWAHALYISTGIFAACSLDPELADHQSLDPRH